VAPAAATAAATPAAAAAAPAAAAALAAPASAGDHDSTPMEATHEQRLAQEQVDFFSRVQT